MKYHIIKLYERLSYMVMIKEINRFDMHRLVELSLMWEKEDSCYGYRANTEDDLKDRYILAAYDNELIAYVFGKEEVQDKQTSVINKNMHYFEIEELYVHPSYRSRGIGKQLMESLEKELKKKRARNDDVKYCNKKLESNYALLY